MRIGLPMILGTAALAVAFAAPAADDSKESKNAPGFNGLDKDKDGAISQTEAAGNPKLAARFKDVDSDNDGKLSRAEYLRTMAAQDFDAFRDLITPGSPSASTGDSATAGGTKAK